MIIFLYGPDTYRSRQKLNEIIEHYKKIHKSGLNLRCFEDENFNFQEFKNEIQSISMFAEKKLFVLKNVFSNIDFKENFLNSFKKFLDSKNIILFYEEGEVDKKDPLFENLKKHVKSQEFELLDGQKLKNWTKTELKNYGVNIENEALEKLIDFVGNNLWQLSNEIKKLANYKNKKKIEKEDVELLVKPKIESDIFKTIDSLAEKKKDRALVLIHQHLERGDNPLYLLRMINFQFRNLLIMKSYELRRESYTPRSGLRFATWANYMQTLSEKLGMRPYVIRKTTQQVRAFSLDELKKIYQKIFKADLDIKTGKMDPETALDLLIAGI